jgi:hypothetical protein
LNRFPVQEEPGEKMGHYLWHQTKGADAGQLRFHGI